MYGIKQNEKIAKWRHSTFWELPTTAPRREVDGLNWDGRQQGRDIGGR